MEGKSLIILVISALLMTTLLVGCAPTQTGEVEVQEEEEVQEIQEIQDKHGEQSNMLMSEEEFSRIMNCLDEQVPEIWNEWSDYYHKLDDRD